MSNLRYQLYGLKTDGSLGKSITTPIYTKERAYRYYRDCAQCALVSINEFGTIVEVIERNTTPIKVNNNKPKTIKRKI